MKKLSFSLTLLTLLTVAVLTGCTLNQNKVDPTLQNIADGWKKISSLSYVSKNIFSAYGGSTEMKYYANNLDQKNISKTRMEIEMLGEQVVLVADQPNKLFFLYHPSSNKYATLDSEDSLDSAETFDFIFGQILQGYNVKGSETINGYDSYLIESSDQIEKEKIWISKQFDVPVKIQSYDQTGTLVLDQEFVEISTDLVGDDKFALPEGAIESTLEEILNYNIDEQQ